MSLIVKKPTLNLVRYGEDKFVYRHPYTYRFFMECPNKMNNPIDFVLEQAVDSDVCYKEAVDIAYRNKYNDLTEVEKEFIEVLLDVDLIENLSLSNFKKLYNKFLCVKTNTEDYYSVWYNFVDNEISDSYVFSVMDLSKEEIDMYIYNNENVDEEDIDKDTKYYNKDKNKNSIFKSDSKDKDTVDDSSDVVDYFRGGDKKREVEKENEKDEPLFTF